MKIDLNSDLGEGAGHDDEILELVSSANIACGLHAGTPASIYTSIESAQKHGVSIGAHPSFDDRKNYGRTEMQVSPAEIFAVMTYQLGAFSAMCRAARTRMNHVKPHGALYNMAARDRTIAEPVVYAVRDFDPELVLFAAPGSFLELAARELNLRTAAEFFADRNYNADDSLVSRRQPNALLRDPDMAAERVMRMLREGAVQTTDGIEIKISAETICVHGDTPGAVEFARRLRQRLEGEGILIAPP